MNTGKIGEFLSKIPAGVWIGLALVGITLIILNHKSDDEKKEEERETDLQKALDAEIEAAKNRGLKPTHKLSDYPSLADRIYMSVKGGGTDEDNLQLAFALMFNDLDYLLVKKYFGIRKDLNFQQWLDSDLSPFDKQVVNIILKKRGIKYTV